MTINLTVTVFVDGLEKFSKTYTKQMDNKIFMTFSSVTIQPGAVELFHKQLLTMYETQVKKDILNIL